MQVKNLDGVSFGAVVSNIDLEDLDEEPFAELYQIWLDRALLIFPKAHLTLEAQDTFAKRFGKLEFPKAVPISNIDKDGKVHSSGNDDVVKSLRGNEGWHHDSTYMPIQAKGAVFSAEIIPSEGGSTGWADMRAAYEQLDDQLRKKINELTASHSLYYSQGRAGYLPSKQNDDGTYEMYGYHNQAVPLRPLVKVHPETGRPNLVIGRHAHDITGMDAQESESLLDELNDWACQQPRTYHHQWEVGDVVIWDNRRLMHRGTPFDMSKPRRMWHTRIAGEPQTELALNH
jgi:alpha-ketoglutarate-dependent taurine dioxygenase